MQVVGDDEIVHLGESQALELVKGRIDRKLADRLRAHADGCEACRAFVAALVRVVVESTDVSVHGRPSLREGAVVGRYRLLHRVGKGGMGEVWAAHDPALDRSVAIKFLRMELAASSPLALLREAEVLAQLCDPHVVVVLEVVHEDGLVALVMELVDGTTLDVWQRAPGRTQREILDCYTQAARGLAAAHGAGIVHHDVKPQNVLVGPDGRARVVDFGLAKLAYRTAEITRPVDVDDAPSGRETVAGGTPGFMAPEVFAGVRGDARSDQFSFCVALWEALTGTRPHGGSQPSTRAMPPSIAGVLRRGLRVEPRERYRNMWELVAALERARQPRAPLRAMAFAVGIAALVPLLSGATQGVPSACVDAQTAMAQLWNPEVAAEAMGAVDPRETVLATLLSQRLTQWSDEWSAELGAACGGAPERVPSRVRCLEDRRRAFGELVERIRRADAEPLARIVDLLGILPRAAECRHAPDLLDAHHAAIRHALWQTAGEIGRDLDEGTQARARALLEQALATDDASLVAFAHNITGLASLAGGRPAEALAQFEAGFFAASQLGDAAVAADSARGAALSLALQGRYDEVLAWLRHIEAASGGDPDPQAAAEVAALRSEAHRALGDAQLADAELARGLAIAPPDSSARAALLSLRGRELVRLGHYADALSAFEEELVIEEAHFGPDHPQLAVPLQGVGAARASLGSFDAAAVAHDRALALLDAHGHDNPVRMAYARANYAAFLERRGDVEGAWAIQRRAAQDFERELGPDSVRAAKFLLLQARYEAKLRRFADALATAERAIDVYQRHTGAAPCEPARLRADALGHVDRVEEALEAWDAALACKPIDDDDRGRAHEGRARLLASLGRWAEAAIAVGRARADYARGPNTDAATKAELERFAATVPRSR